MTSCIRSSIFGHAWLTVTSHDFWKEVEWREAERGIIELQEKRRTNFRQPHSAIPRNCLFLVSVVAWRQAHYSSSDLLFLVTFCLRYYSHNFSRTYSRHASKRPASSGVECYCSAKTYVAYFNWYEWISELNFPIHLNGKMTSWRKLQATTLCNSSELQSVVAWS